MTNEYFEKIVNVETGEETIRPYTKDEIAIMKKAAAESQVKQETIEAAKLSTEAKLAALGLTVDDLKVLGL
jgi:hypothetical protein